MIIRLYPALSTNIFCFLPFLCCIIFKQSMKYFPCVIGYKLPTKCTDNCFAGNKAAQVFRLICLTKNFRHLLCDVTNFTEALCLYLYVFICPTCTDECTYQERFMCFHVVTEAATESRPCKHFYLTKQQISSVNHSPNKDRPQVRNGFPLGLICLCHFQIHVGE